MVGPLTGTIATDVVEQLFVLTAGGHRVNSDPVIPEGSDALTLRVCTGEADSHRLADDEVAYVVVHADSCVLGDHSNADAVVGISELSVAVFTTEEQDIVIGGLRRYNGHRAGT